MTRIGSEKRPVIARVHSDAMARYVAETCVAHGWHYIIEFDHSEPENIDHLKRALNTPQQVVSEKIGRNEPCPCGSGKKHKKCCGTSPT
jgi:SWIM/SEC-C metal-binding protein